MTVTAASFLYRNNRSFTRVNALDSLTRPFWSTATGFSEQAMMTLTVSVLCIVVLIVRSWVTMGSREISLLFALGSNSGWIVVMVFQTLSTLNLKRMSCKACLSAGRLSINDIDYISSYH